MAKPSLTSQFDEIQARLEDAGLTVRRDERFDIRAELLLQPAGESRSRHIATLNIRRSFDRFCIAGWVSIYGAGDSANDSESPTAVLNTLLAKPFGRTTIGAVFGIAPD